MPGRYRWMYYATGMPGWMRFGFSPGWVGRSPTGLGPCATYLTTGQWPNPWFQNPQGAASGEQATVPRAPAPPGSPFGWFNPMATVPKEQQMQMLEEQAKALQDQLDQVKQMLDELKSQE